MRLNTLGMGSTNTNPFRLLTLPPDNAIPIRVRGLSGRLPQFPVTRSYAPPGPVCNSSNNRRHVSNFDFE